MEADTSAVPFSTNCDEWIRPRPCYTRARSHERPKCAFACFNPDITTTQPNLTLPNQNQGTIALPHVIEANET